MVGFSYSCTKTFVVGNVHPCNATKLVKEFIADPALLQSTIAKRESDILRWLIRCTWEQSISATVNVAYIDACRAIIS